MSERISHRHRGDFGGRFTDTRLPAKVTLLLEADVARLPAAQHLSWMLLNLLARQTAEILELELQVPKGIPVVERLSPLISETEDLSQALAEGIARIHPEVLEVGPTVRSQVSVRIGPGPLGEADYALATTAYGWSGYVGCEPAPFLGDDTHPVGAYIAASLSAGEIFKYVRGMRADAGTFVRRIWLDAASLEISSEPPTRRLLLPADLVLLPAVVAGIGAVGNGLLHTLYPLADAIAGELTLLDGDVKGVGETNLNRYVLFGREHIACQKASLVAHLFAKSQLVMHAVDEDWQAWYPRAAERSLGLVLSAVDKNSARHAIQAALPRLILGASTNEMRVLLNFYDVLGGGPCLRCRNPVEEAVPDDVLSARLRSLPFPERILVAQRVGVSPSTLEAYLQDPHGRCGLMSGTSLQKFADESDQAEWSVGFVSLLAGVLLAAAYLKMSIQDVPLGLTSLQNTFRFQFWHPENSEVNRVVGTPPETACLCQTPAFRHAVKFL